MLHAKAGSEATYQLCSFKTVDYSLMVAFSAVVMHTGPEDISECRLHW
jgi:hypothetical protein